MNRGNCGANLPVLRGHNAALVLDLLRSATAGGGAGISRLELAERTGLTPQAVSKIVARLRAEGMATEAGRRASTGGKPRTLLRLVPSARYAIGLHLDRDEMTAVLVDLTGERVAVRTAPFDLGADPAAVLDAVAARVRELLTGVDRRAVLGAGAAVPGPLDHRSGVLRRVTRFPHWDGFPLGDALADRLGLPVTVDKDTNAAALAVLGLRDAPPESRPAEGADAAPSQLADPAGSFAYLHLGTGLGAGLVLDGAVYRGPRTGAGEFGHQVVRLDGPPCGCGKRGCLEALCLAALNRADTVTAARLLGVGAANLVALLDIDRVVLGGRAVLAARETFAAGVAAVLAEQSAHPVPVTVAPADRPTVADGAARLVLAPVFGREALG
ncbi:ROK family transcriptional regulator [Streptomyces silvisoli]|uniref:ROK family transcriptional regulator n=1 Tax=Streptomyces silvisoli TaxID=3034235 RepID=A0ABT5ZST3_9ACTN|nr:ROK family transcriptional regulator [Streptomyces silvisoli]MDF3292893.1 ROK family transcriptional regulator [Streptomyces silvisoli]